MFCDFITTTYAKWILAGEHAVLRGHGALVFPLKQKRLILTYSSSPTSLTADYTGFYGNDLHLLFWSVLEQGAKLLGRSLNQLEGHFHLDNSIPVGAGMGASAALCVAMSRWFCAQRILEADQCTKFAKELEHLFHGKSSGLDIAGVASEGGVYFKEGFCEPLSPVIQPKWFLSSCKQIGITAHCIQQVNGLWQENADLAQKIDEQMAAAVNECRSVLESGGIEAIPRLAIAINNASSCFEQWD